MSKFEIHADNHSASVTATGDNTEETKQQMSKLLNAIDPLLDGEITEMQIDVSTNGDSTEMVEVSPQETQSDTPDGVSNKVGPMGDVDRPSPTNRNWEEITEDRRDQGTFSSGSSYHVIASTLYEADEALESREIRNRLDEINPGTVSGGLSKLYERCVLNRNEGKLPESGGRSRSTYSLTDHGVELIEEKGTFSQEDWLDQ